MSAKECRVLIVEDDADTREALAEALADAGFIVEQAGSAVEALEHIMKNGQPDVILLDLRMPGMDGTQFLDRSVPLKSRVIVLTGDASARLLEVARNARVMQKPVDLDELEAAVKAACAA